MDLELESNDEESKNDKDKNTNDDVEQRPRKGSRRISILSAEIDGKKAVSFLGALRIPVISIANFNLDLSLKYLKDFALVITFQSIIFCFRVYLNILLASSLPNL